MNSANLYGSGDGGVCARVRDVFAIYENLTQADNDNN